jgi:hypothetical protein
MDMNKTPCDMCKDCFVPKAMEQFDPYDSEEYFTCSVREV